PYFSSLFSQPSAPTPLYTLSLHDALPISLIQQRCVFYIWMVQELPVVHQTQQTGQRLRHREGQPETGQPEPGKQRAKRDKQHHRSEEHTSELQSRFDIVCRLLLEKKKQKP